jgi:hypothetical protein
MPTRGFGWKPDFDPGNDAYPLRLGMDVPHALRTVDTNWAIFRSALDQHDEGTCVGMGCQYFEEIGPVIGARPRPPGRPNARALEIYDRAWKLDDGNDPAAPVDRQSGITVNAGFKVLREDGVVKEWRHVWDADAVIQFLAGEDADGHRIGGPVVMGLPWLEGMMEPDAEGLLHATGPLQGYHCVCFKQWRQSKGLIRFPQSWGRGYGDNGYVQLPAEDLRTLMTPSAGGHGVIALEVRRTNLVES